MQFIKNIQNFAFQNNLWTKSSGIIVGVSGGPDSTCLFEVLYQLSKKYDFKLHIAHVNYDLRGIDSLEDEIFVRKLGEKYGIEVSILKADRKKYKGNLENNLREIRYEYFEKLRTKLNFDLVAVGHNLDDQVETVIMRILRGSGLNGLAAMKSKSSHVIRPLLQTSKNDILAFLKEKNINYQTDCTNAETEFLRNKIRHKLIPHLEKDYNKAIKQTISSSSLAVAQDYEYLDAQISRKMKFVEKKNKGYHFNSTELLNLPPAIINGILRNIIRDLKGNLLDIDFSHIEEIKKMLTSNKSKNQNLMIKGLKIEKKGDKVIILFK